MWRSAHHSTGLAFFTHRFSATPQLPNDVSVNDVRACFGKVTSYRAQLGSPDHPSFPLMFDHILYL